MRVRVRVFVCVCVCVFCFYTKKKKIKKEMFFLLALTNYLHHVYFFWKKKNERLDARNFFLFVFIYVRKSKNLECLAELPAGHANSELLLLRQGCGDLAASRCPVAPPRDSRWASVRPGTSHWRAAQEHVCHAAWRPSSAVAATCV